MIKEILSVFSWVLSARPSISTSHWGPFIHKLPTYLHDKFDAMETPHVWNVATISIENIAPHTLGAVRIKLNRKLIAAPEISGDQSSFSDWTFDECKSELTILNLDPGKRLYADVFCHLDNQEGEIAPEFFVDGQLHGKAQKFIADWITLFKGKFGILYVAIVVIVITLLAYTFIKIIAPCTLEDSDACRLSVATSRIKGYCSFKVAKVTTNTRFEIESSGFPVEMTMFINKASRMDDLLNRDKIVICAPVAEDSF